MEIKVLAIGTRAPDWVNAGVGHYQKRLPQHINLSFNAMTAAARSRSVPAEKCRQQEGQRLLKAIPAGAYVIALDEHGESWGSKDLARQLEMWLGNHSSVALMIGGADGLADSCKLRADKIWSLSALTLPHTLVRVLLSEQLYRAWTLLQGHPYHRD